MDLAAGDVIRRGLGVIEVSENLHLGALFGGPTHVGVELEQIGKQSFEVIWDVSKTVAVKT